MVNITVQNDLDTIVRTLGKYFGIMSKSSFLRHLATGVDTQGFEMPSGDETNLITNLGDVIMDMQAGGMQIHDIIQQVNDLANTDVENVLDISLPNTFRITYEKEGITDTSTCKVINGTTAGAKMNDQGWPETDVYSINAMLGLEGDDANVNKDPLNPDKDTSPALSVIQVFPSRLTPANRDTGALALFLNSISTLEISRAVPFIDITAISKSPTLAHDDGDPTSGRIMNMSLGQFLLGNDRVSGMDAKLLSVVDAAVAKDPPQIYDDPDVAGSDPAPPFGFPFSTSGMEMFTSPQTLVNADEVHMEYDSPAGQERNVLTGDVIEDTKHPGGKRAAPVVDRFRPFMSLVEFKINVTPTMGMMSYKSADMKLVLHDKSRLAEISAFVKPDAFFRTHFLIEYGWAHPDNKVHGFQPLGGALNLRALEDSPNNLPDSLNLMGIFIGSLRCREKYMVVNSSFSFDDVGQVEINVKLAMVGGNDGNEVKIGHGGRVEEQVKAIEKITEAISEIRKKINGSDNGEGSEDVTGSGNVLGVASSTESAVNMSKDNLEKIQKFLKKNKGKDTVQEIELLKQSFSELLGPTGDGKSGKLADLKNTIAAEVDRKINALKGTPDPWLRDLDTNATKIKRSDTAKYVSLGKILTLFLGLPIAQSRKYDDVQLYFYALNDKSSFVRDMNIAQFPIPIDDFNTLIRDELKLEANMPILKFMNFLNKGFMLDQGTPAYGMTSIFGERDKDDKIKREINKKFAEDSTLLFNEKQKILRAAYGDGEELSFKLPSLQAKWEVVPAADKTKADNGIDMPGAEKTILRIHFYDKQTTSYNCLAALLNASKKSQLGVITKSAGNIKDKTTANSQHALEFNAYIADAISQGLLESIPINASAMIGDDPGVPAESIGDKPRFRIAGGFSALKNYLMRAMPSVRYGAQNCGILKANVQSMQNPLLATINMQRQGINPGDEPQGKRDAGVPMTVQPIECNVDTIGCPLWEFSQQIFLDFGTGTTVDNIYAVTGIDHTISQGKFNSSVRLTQLTAYGVYESMLDKISEASAVLADAEKT